MLPSTRLYKEKAKETVRRWKGRVQIDYTDPFIDQSIDAEASEASNYSHPTQTANNVEEPSEKWASLDGSWVLDGSYHLMPEDDSEQIGWWGSQLSGVEGVFSTPLPTLTINFFSRPVRQLKVVGDSKRAEWPVDFYVTLYNEAGDVLHNESITDNALINWKTAIPLVSEVTKMRLAITKWSEEGRQAKILEFFTSVQETYEGDDILSISLQEEREISNGSLPIGNISANEIDIKLNNINNKFDAGNVGSSIYQLLKANRRIKAWIGLDLLNESAFVFDEKEDVSAHEVSPEETIESDVHVSELFQMMFGMTPEYTEAVEWKPLGTFWSGDWDVPESEVWAQTSGRDRLELLSQTTFSSSQVLMNTNLYELAVTVLEDSGLTPSDYWVDEKLMEYDIPYAWFEPSSHRKILRLIAEACLGQVYQDRLGVVRVEGAKFLEENRIESQIDLTRDDYFSKSQPIAWSQIANNIEVGTNPLRPTVMPEEVYSSNEPEPISAGETRTITIYYNESPAIETVASLEGDGSITNVNYYAWGAGVTVTSSIDGEFSIIVEGKPLKVLNRDRIILRDEESIVDNGRIDYKFPDNHLVQRKSVAQKIADGLAVFSNPRRDVEHDWRGDPAVELADRFTSPDFKDVSTADFHIVSQSLEFDGGLSSTIKGRRAMDA